jgi:outer membrane protein assembly factor BamD
MPHFKGTAIFEDLYYKYAYCAYYQKDYLNAENLFKNFLEAFPNSSKAEELDYMRAYCYYKMSPKVALDQSNTMRAMGMLQTFINTTRLIKIRGQWFIDICVKIGRKKGLGKIILRPGAV